MSSNAPTPIPKAKRRGIPLQSGKTTGAGLCARFLRLPALPRFQRGLPCYGAARYPRCYRHRQRRLPPQRRRPFARWQSAIADWHRHLYLTNNTLREVAPMKCCCWAIPRRTCPSLRRYTCSQRPGDRTNPVCRHPPTGQPVSPPRLPPSLSISPSPPGYATRRSAREVAMSPAPLYVDRWRPDGDCRQVMV